MNTNKRLIIIILSLIIISSCSTKKNKTEIQVGKVIIRGKVQMVENCSKVISLSYSNSTDRCDYGTEIIDSAGNFRFEFEVLNAQDVLLHYEKGYTKLYIQPSDSLTLTLNAVKYKKERFPDYKISGTNSHISKEILKYLQYRNLKEFQPIVKGKSVEEYLNDLRAYILIEDSVLSAFSNIHNPSATFLMWAEKDIIYQYANYIGEFDFYHQMNKSSYEGDPFDKRLFPVNDDDAIISSWYDHHLKSNSYTYFRKDTLVKELMNEENYSSAYRIVLNNIIKNEDAGISRELMCYRLLSELLKKSGSEFLLLAKDVNMFLNNEDLIALIDKRMAEFESKDKFHISRFDADTQEEKEIIGDIFQNLADRHQGKVMYIDIWATWCGPCKSEIPHAIELHNYFEKAPIVFVNLCLASSKIEWEKAMKNPQLVGEHYYFNREQTELLRNKLKFSGYPTYMIIDKNGNITDGNAPRPSSNEIIKKKLKKLIRESHQTKAEGISNPTNSNN